MLKKLMIIAGAALCFAATPAQAQSLGAVLDLVTQGANPARNLAGNGCRFGDQIAKLTCRANAGRQLNYRVGAYRHRVAEQKRISEARRAVREGRPVSIDGHVLRLCSWRIAGYCDQIGITSAQALALMNANSTPQLRQIKPERYYISADEREALVDAM